MSVRASGSAALGAVLPAAVPAAQASFLAFDFGLKRTGVATGNRLTRTATPQRTIRAEGDARWAPVQARIEEWRPDALVVGVPLMGKSDERIYIEQPTHG